MQKAADKAKADKENDRPAATAARTGRSKSMVTPPTSMPTRPPTGTSSHLELEFVVLTPEDMKPSMSD